MSNPHSNFPQAKVSEIPDIGKSIGRLDEVMNLPPCKKNEPKEVEERIKQMFQFCKEDNRRPTVELLSAFLGVSRITLWKWQSDENSEAGRLVERAKEVINALLTEMAMTNKAPYPYVIWSQKNNEGYREVVELIPTRERETLPTKESIINKLPDLAPGEKDNEDILDDEE